MRPTIASVVGIGVPSKYLLFPVASFGTEATVTLNLARRERPQRTKKVRITVSSCVRKPMEKAQTAGATPNEIYTESNKLGDVKRAGVQKSCTKSARESSSCPMSDDFFLHLATFPSIKSKKRPNGIKTIAAHRYERSSAEPRQYRSDENIDIIPQKPVRMVHCQLTTRNRFGEVIEEGAIVYHLAL